jgi:hypothetical protein
LLSRRPYDLCPEANPAATVPGCTAGPAAGAAGLAACTATRTAAAAGAPNAATVESSMGLGFSEFFHVFSMFCLVDSGC